MHSGFCYSTFVGDPRPSSLFPEISLPSCPCYIYSQFWLMLMPSFPNSGSPLTTLFPTCATFYGFFSRFSTHICIHRFPFGIILTFPSSLGSQTRIDLISPLFFTFTHSPRSREPSQQQPSTQLSSSSAQCSHWTGRETNGHWTNVSSVFFPSGLLITR